MSNSKRRRATPQSNSRRRQWSDCQKKSTQERILEWTVLLHIQLEIFNHGSPDSFSALFLDYDDYSPGRESHRGDYRRSGELGQARLQRHGLDSCLGVGRQLMEPSGMGEGGENAAELVSPGGELDS